MPKELKIDVLLAFSLFHSLICISICFERNEITKRTELGLMNLPQDSGFARGAARSVLRLVHRFIVIDAVVVLVFAADDLVFRPDNHFAAQAPENDAAKVGNDAGIRYEMR